MNEPAPRRPFPWALVRHWTARYLILWLPLAALIFIVQLVLSAVLHEREDVGMFLGMLDRLPPIFKAFIGGDQLMASNVQSIVAIGYQHPTVLVMLMINAVATPTGLLTAQAEQGQMELLLARPITRSRVFWIASAISLMGQFTLAWTVFVGTAIWTRVFDYGEVIGLAPFAPVALNLAVLAGCVGCLSILCATVFSERNRAVGWIVGYVVLTYLLDFAAVMLPSLEAFHPLSLFNYYRPLQVLKLETFPTVNVVVLSSIGVVALLIAWARWRSRDIFAA